MTEPKVRWAIRYRPHDGGSPRFTMHNGNVTYFSSAASAWLACWKWRTGSSLTGSFKVVRLTTPPRAVDDPDSVEMRRRIALAKSETARLAKDAAALRENDSLLHAKLRATEAELAKLAKIPTTRDMIGRRMSIGTSVYRIEHATLAAHPQAVGMCTIELTLVKDPS